MTAQQLEKHWKASPFRPFRVNIADGRSFAVPHRDFIWRHPTGRTVFIATGEDEYEVIDLMMVTTLSIGFGDQSSRDSGQST